MKQGTFYICWGESGGFRFEWTKNIKRLVLWRIAFAYMNVDVEQLMDELFKLKGVK